MSKFQTNNVRSAITFRTTWQPCLPGMRTVRTVCSIKTFYRCNIKQTFSSIRGNSAPREYVTLMNRLWCVINTYAFCAQFLHSRNRRKYVVIVKQKCGQLEIQNRKYGSQMLTQKHLYMRERTTAAISNTNKHVCYQRYYLSHHEHLR